MSDAAEMNPETCCAMSAPTEAHDRLKPFIGSFKAEVTMWMEPGEPMVSTGMMTNTLELDGRFLHQIYQGDATDGPFPNFQGRGYWGYNTIDNRYESLWIDTASTHFWLEYGQVDDAGKVWTMLGSSTDPETGKSVRRKSIITLHDDNTHEMEMFTESSPEGNWNKCMRVVYTRA